MTAGLRFRTLVRQRNWHPVKMPRDQALLEFAELMKWCSDVAGAGNFKYSSATRRIAFKEEKAAMMFILRWGEPE